MQPGFTRQEISSLISEYENTETNTLDALLDYHVRFEEIPPFGDDDGRAWRLILMNECLRFGIDPFIIDDKHRGNYNKGIVEWPKDSRC